MKKLYYYPSAVIASLILSLSSCTESDSYINVIPQNAGPIASINLSSLGEKAGIGDSDNKEAIAQLTDMLKNEMKASTFEKMEQIIKDPNKAGIDIKKPVYIFDNDDFRMAITAKVSDESDLLNTFRIIENESDIKSVSEEDGYTLVIVNNKTFAAFNDKTLLMAEYKKAKVSIEDIKADISTLLNQNEKESMASDKGFQKMLKNDSDIELYSSFDELDYDLYKSFYNNALGRNDAAEKSKVISEINFEKGKIQIDSEFYTDDKEILAEIEKKCSYLKTINNKLLKHFPKSTLAIISLSMNGEKVYESLKENKDFQKNISLEEAKEIEMLMKSLGNEVSIGLVDFGITKSPSILVFAEAENGNVLKEIYEEKKPEMIELAENEYVIKERTQNIFVGYKNNLLYATNNESLYREVGQDVSPSALENSYAGEIKGSNYAMAINMQAIYELPIIKMLAEMGRGNARLYIDMLKSIDNVYITGKGENISLTVQLTNTKENSLKQIGNFAKEFAGIKYGIK